MEKTVYLRKVTKEDAALLYEWANDDECRQNSFHSNHIEWEEHVDWLDKQLSDPSVFLFVLVNEGYDIGQIRLDRKEDCYVISYSIAKPYRLMGYGKQILMLAENYLYELQGNALLYAQVKKDNIASQLLFEGLGYDKHELENHVEYEKSVERYGDDILYKKMGGVRSY